MEQQAEAEQSFLKLYEEFADPLFRHCYFRVSSSEVAEDLVQESFMKTWNYLTTGKTLDNPKAFLYRIAGNLVIDYYRKKKTSSLDALADTGFDPAGDDEESILLFTAGNEAVAMLEQLEPDYREVLTMRFVQELSIREIAIEVGQSENAVSVRIHRAINKLKKLLHYDKPT